MLPPMLKIMLEEPGLLSGYFGAYATLLKQDAKWWRAREVRRIAYWLALAGGALFTVSFGGIALMLYAATGVNHWLLWAVPAAPLLVAIIAGWRLSQFPAPTPPFPRVREQIAQDMQLFRFEDTR